MTKNIGALAQILLNEFRMQNRITLDEKKWHKFELKKNLLVKTDPFKLSRKEEKEEVEKKIKRKCIEQIAGIRVK